MIDGVRVCMCIHSEVGGDVHLQGPPEWNGYTIHRWSHYQPEFDDITYTEPEWDHTIHKWSHYQPQLHNTTYPEPVLWFVWGHQLKMETGKEIILCWFDV